MVGELKPQTSFWSWRLESETQVWAGLVPPETSLLGVLTAVCSVSPGGRPCVCLYVPIASSYKDPGPMRSGPSPSDHIFSFTSSLKIFIFKYSLTLRSWGFRTSTYECQQWRTRVQPITGYLFLVIML